MKNNIKIISTQSWDGVISEWVEIDKGNNEFTYISKETYEQSAAE
jgi:hypothetical protein